MTDDELKELGAEVMRLTAIWTEAAKEAEVAYAMLVELQTVAAEARRMAQAKEAEFFAAVRNMYLTTK